MVNVGVVAPCSGKLKVILTTNVAESSVTLEDVNVVIDFGLLKLRHEYALTTEWVSKHNVLQRAGRKRRKRRKRKKRRKGRKRRKRRKRKKRRIRRNRGKRRKRYLRSKPRAGCVEFWVFEARCSQNV